MTGMMVGAGLMFAPFRGLRYAVPGTIAERLAPPYDVISPEQRRELAKQDTYNIVNLDLPVAPPGEDAYRYAADLLGIWQRRGELVRESDPAVYVLRTTTTLADGRELSRTGVFMAVATIPFGPGSRVRPHERTHAGPKEDRRKLTVATGCNMSPIFLLCPDGRGDIASTLTKVTKDKPWAVAEAIGGRHEVWIVKGPIAMRLALLASDEKTYIADGHHRYETAVYVAKEDRDLPKKWTAGAQRTLAHLVSFKDPGLAILPTHRVVEGKPLERSAVLKAANPYFARALKGQTPTLTVVFHDGSEAAMALRPDADLSAATELPQHASLRDLPVAIADFVFLKLVIEKLLKKTPNLRYTPAESEARANAEGEKVACAIILPATTLEQVQAVSDAGEFMPPKSTFFAPKVPTGIVMRLFEGEL